MSADKTLESVGETGTMPGTEGFTMAVFEAAKVPIGTPLYGPAAITTIEERDARIAHLEKGCSATNDDVCQALGRVLGYPWFKDDQDNFPGAIETDGVCVGEHVAESIADEAAGKIVAQAARIAELQAFIDSATATAIQKADAAEARALKAEGLLEGHATWKAAFIEAQRSDIADVNEEMNRLRALLEEAVKGLEWALDKARADHPHYPERTGGGWHFPYLVHGSPLGGGVGHARYGTALEAVKAAMTWPPTDDDAPSRQTLTTIREKTVNILPTLKGEDFQAGLTPQPE